MRNISEIKSEWVTLKVDEYKMELFVSKPKVSKAPAIIVLQEAFGVNAHIQTLTKRFALEGYYAVAPALFHRSAGPKFEAAYENFEVVMPHYNAVTPEGLKADLYAILQHLQALSEVNSQLIASVGFCMGGKVSFFANSVLPLKAAVSFYGGGIVPDLLPLADRQNAPLLLFWGGQDGHATKAERQELNESLHKADKNFVEVEFSKAHHGFFNEERKGYHEQAAAESWSLTLAFLKCNFTLDT